jgi:DNA-binding XRE family transcriptional regulator
MSTGQAGSVVTLFIVVPSLVWMFRPMTTSCQLKAERLMLGLTRRYLAKRVAVLEKTIRNAETQGRRSALLIESLPTLYEAAGIDFITEDNGRGARLKKTNERAPGGSIEALATSVPFLLWMLFGFCC